MGERGKGFETREKREERQLNQIGWSFLTPTPLHTSTHTHTYTYYHCLPQGAMVRACSQADRQEINRALGRVCMSVSDVLATCWWRHVPC